MADSEEIKKLNNELDKLEFSLKSIADSLSERLNNSLVTSNTQAQKLVDSFEKGENITSKIYNELFKNQEKSNKLALNKIKLETDLSKAQSNNNFKAEKSIRIALYQNQLTSNQLDKNDTLLRQLEGIVEEEEKITKEKQKQNSISEILKNNLYKILGTNKANIKEMFTLSGIFSLIISKALEFNKTSVELSKNLGYSAFEADKMVYGLAASSVFSNNINLNEVTFTVQG